MGTGFLFTEGPLWHPTGKFLLFSDMPGDHLRRWSAADGVTTFRKPCNMSNGLTYDRQGRLVACEHASSQVTRTERDGRIVPLATHHQGKQLNSPNDVVCRSDGGIYFSDPPYGRAKFYGVERPQELAFQGVYRVGADPKSPVLLVDDFDRPNGLCFSLDRPPVRKRHNAKQIRLFDVAVTARAYGGCGRKPGERPGARRLKLDRPATLLRGPGGIPWSIPREHPGDPAVTDHTRNSLGETTIRSLLSTPRRRCTGCAVRVPVSRRYEAPTDKESSCIVARCCSCSRP